jgi:hypothetical protein
MNPRHEPLPPENLPSLPQPAPEVKQEVGYIIHMANPVGMFVLRGEDIFFPMIKKGCDEPELRNLKDFLLEAKRRRILAQATQKEVADPKLNQG